MRLTGYAIIVGYVVAIGTAMAGAKDWAATPPEGWMDVSAEAMRTPQMQEYRQRIIAKGGSIELAINGSPDGDIFVVFFTREPYSGRDAGQDVRDTAAGMHDGIARGMFGEQSKLNHTMREVRDTLIVESVIKASGKIAWVRSLAGVTESHMISLLVICTGPEMVCNTALQSLVLNREGFRPLSHRSVIGVNPESDAYKQGQAEGELALVAIGVLGWLWLMIRIFRKPGAKRRSR